MELLPEGILEQCLLRLPYVAILLAKQVCRKWKQVIDSRSFARSYRGTVKLVERTHYGESTATTFEIIDSSDSVVRWAKEGEFFGSLTSRINGLVLKVLGDADDEESYIGNMFSNKWERIPAPPGGPVQIPDAAILDLGGGHFRVVYWVFDDDDGETIATLETGQTEWSITRSDRDTWWYSNAVVIGNSVFRVHYRDGVLVEYESVLRKASTSRITSEEKEALDFGRDLYSVNLILWQGGLYLLIVDKDPGHTQTVEIWRISTSDARAAFVNKFEMEWRLRFIQVEGVEGHGLVHLGGDLRDDPGTRLSLAYSMCAGSVAGTSFGSSRVIRESLVQMPVKLAE